MGESLRQRVQGPNSSAAVFIRAPILKNYTDHRLRFFLDAHSGGFFEDCPLEIPVGRYQTPLVLSGLDEPMYKVFDFGYLRPLDQQDLNSNAAGACAWWVALFGVNP